MAKPDDFMPQPPWEGPPIPKVFNEVKKKTRRKHRKVGLDEFMRAAKESKRQYSILCAEMGLTEFYEPAQVYFHPIAKILNVFPQDLTTVIEECSEKGFIESWCSSRNISNMVFLWKEKGYRWSKWEAGFVFKPEIWEQYEQLHV